MPHSPLRALIFALAACIAGAAGAQQAEYLGSFTWSGGGASAFGGFSGLELDADGRAFIAVTDRGFLATGHLQRRAGRISAVSETVLKPLVSGSGPLKDYMADAEGLAVTPDGLVFVSFEGYHRVARLDPDTGRVGYIPRAAEFDALQTNSSLEALATDPEGRAITLPERSGEWERPFPVFRLDGDTWSQPYSIRRDSKFLPVGADTGPDGRLYLLERHFTGVAFASRVRSFAFIADGLGDEQLVLQTPPGRHDNLEGISLWRDHGDRIRLTMISDDNFVFLQRTEFVEYALTPGSGPRAGLETGRERR